MPKYQYVRHIHSKVHENQKSSGTGVILSCEPLCGSWELNLVLKTDTFLQPYDIFSGYYF